jgi:hypothetical protein
MVAVIWFCSLKKTLDNTRRSGMKHKESDVIVQKEVLPSVRSRGQISVQLLDEMVREREHRAFDTCHRGQFVQNNRKLGCLWLLGKG